MMLHSWLDQLKLIKLRLLIENSPHYTTWEIANILRVSKLSIENCLHQLGYVSCFDVWAPLKWKKNPQKLLGRISAYRSLLKHNENILFLKRIVRSGEKWIPCDKVEWKRVWGKWGELPTTTSKPAGFSSNECWAKEAKRGGRGLAKFWWWGRKTYVCKSNSASLTACFVISTAKFSSSSKEGDVVYIVGLERSPLLWVPCRKPNSSNKYAFN